MNRFENFASVKFPTDESVGCRQKTPKQTIVQQSAEGGASKK